MNTYSAHTFSSSHSCHIVSFVLTAGDSDGGTMAALELTVKDSERSLSSGKAANEKDEAQTSALDLSGESSLGIKCVDNGVRGHAMIRDP